MAHNWNKVAKNRIFHQIVFSVFKNWLTTCKSKNRWSCFPSLSCYRAFSILAIWIVTVKKYKQDRADFVFEMFQFCVAPPKLPINSHCRQRCLPTSPKDHESENQKRECSVPLASSRWVSLSKARPRINPHSVQTLFWGVKCTGFNTAKQQSFRTHGN